MEVIRKLCLVANWLFFGGIALFIVIVTTVDEDIPNVLLWVTAGSLIAGFIVQKIVNWVFQ